MKIYYHDAVEIFIKNLQKPAKSKILRSIDLIEEYGIKLTFPHVRKITDKIYELRIRGNQEVRIFYIIQNNSAILIHGFIKKTQKTPKQDIETAKKRIQLLT